MTVNVLVLARLTDADAARLMQMQVEKNLQKGIESLVFTVSDNDYEFLYNSLLEGHKRGTLPLKPCVGLL